MCFSFVFVCMGCFFFPNDKVNYESIHTQLAMRHTKMEFGLPYSDWGKQGHSPNPQEILKADLNSLRTATVPTFASYRKG